jgi:hypothetical protein
LANFTALVSTRFGEIRWSHVQPRLFNKTAAVTRAGTNRGRGVTPVTSDGHRIKIPRRGEIRKAPAGL